MKVIFARPKKHNTRDQNQINKTRDQIIPDSKSSIKGSKIFKLKINLNFRLKMDF